MNNSVLGCTPVEMIHKLQEMGKFEGHEGATETLKEMELLFTYCEASGITDKLVFDFSLARGLDYYTGLIYEAVFVQSADTEDDDRVGSISGGGRYDGLVGMFSKEGKVVPCVGGSIGIERIFRLLEKKMSKEKGVRATETQILIGQMGKGLIVDRLKICAELWAAGIKCETLYLENPKP